MTKTTSGCVFFEGFELDPADRRLTRGGAAVELNARYFDALVLLAGEPGSLITKDRLLDEVWRGVPVTDEALTQCIKTLRQKLGDDAAHPRFIETVPKHGYRFIAEITFEGTPRAQTERSWSRLVLLGLGGTVGGGIAGVIGGLLYGFGADSQAIEPIGGASVFLVLLCLNIVVGLAGGAGVSFGIVTAGFLSRRPWQWSVAGGALGGLLVGGFVKLLGLDAFNLLIGQSPGNITGAREGLLLGAALGLGLWLGARNRPAPALRLSMFYAGIAGAIVGALVPLLGGRLMGGSLELLARQFPASRLQLDQIGALFGEQGLGPIALSVTGAVEGLLFGGCTIGAIVLADRDLSAARRASPSLPHTRSAAPQSSR